MRIISGKAKGRVLKAVPGTGTRPTTDKVKEAIFSMIGPYFDGGIVLDLFAGTGGLGIEALSRGMDRAIFVDMDKKSVEVIRHNLQAAGLTEQAEVYRNDAVRALKALGKRGIKLDLVLLDPPYRLHIIEHVLEQMEQLDLLHDRTIVVVEQDASRDPAQRIGSLVCGRRAEYGDTAIMIYRFA